jgi:hypothetical protein
LKSAPRTYIASGLGLRDQPESCRGQQCRPLRRTACQNRSTLVAFVAYPASGTISGGRCLNRILKKSCISLRGSSKAVVTSDRVSPSFIVYGFFPIQCNRVCVASRPTVQYVCELKKFSFLISSRPPSCSGTLARCSLSCTSPDCPGCVIAHPALEGPTVRQGASCVASASSLAADSEGCEVYYSTNWFIRTLECFTQ